jgi:tetratricopeptide (TPR) repeat protein
MTHVLPNTLIMKNQTKHSATIEQYLANEMAPPEKEAFRKELKSNSDLANELKFSQTIDSALMRDDVIDLRRKLIAAITAGRKQQKEVPVVRMHSRKWWYAAASLLILCAVASTLYLQMPGKITNDSLFNQYYSAENIVDQTRGDHNIVEAVMKFQQKDFRAASVLFKGILDKDNSNVAVWFYYGISNIETQNYDNAINAFNVIIEHNDNLYIEHAEWYKGLCYLKNNQKDKAISEFKLVASNPDSFHQQEAKNILEKMKSK